MTRLLHPIPEALQLLGFGRSTLYELIAQRKIRVVKIGRRTFIAHDDLERFIDSLRDEQEVSA